MATRERSLADVSREFANLGEQSARISADYLRGIPIKPGDPPADGEVPQYVAANLRFEYIAGGGGGAPTDAPYLTLGLDAGLSAEISLLEADESTLPSDDVHWKWNEAALREFIIEQAHGTGDIRLRLRASSGRTTFFTLDPYFQFKSVVAGQAQLRNMADTDWADLLVKILTASGGVVTATVDASGPTLTLSSATGDLVLVSPVTGEIDVSADKIVNLGAPSTAAGAPRADHPHDGTLGSTQLFSVHQYIFTPDAAPGADVVTGAHQGTIHVSGPSTETVKRITVICETAAGTAFTFTLDYDSGNDDFDSFVVDTEIDSVAVGTAKGVVVSAGFTTGTIAARSLISLDITLITGSAPKDVTIILEVWRPLQV